MPDLLQPFVLAATPSEGRRVQGVIAPQDPTTGATLVNVAGSVIQARIMDPVIVSVGDVVAVDMITRPGGQSEAWIVGRLTSLPRPGTATVKTVPIGSPTITVTGTDGIDIQAAFVSSYSPAVGDSVILSWTGGGATVMGKAGATSAPPPVVTIPPPPPKPVTGRSTFAAIDSNTYWSGGGWGSWAGGGGKVFQGDYGYGPVTGAFWYGGAPSQLAGRTITRIRLTLGARLQVGSWSDSLTLTVRPHTQRTRTASNVPLTGTSFNLTASPSQGRRTYDIPLSAAPALLAGGGLALVGATYGGVSGRATDPESGKLTIDWSR